jgi:hypothetical protein
VIKALGRIGTGEAARLLIQWVRDPQLSADLTRTDYWRILDALNRTTQPAANQAYKAFLYEDLVGDDVPRSRAALVRLAEIDGGNLKRKLVELAASPAGHLRCLALYGLMKHFSYQGPYDPFHSGDAL